jgi:enoyl-CoA hydratase/carnithine racemase
LPNDSGSDAVASAAPMTGTDQVLFAVDDDGVALLTLNRPDRHNAWTPVMEHAYFDHLEAAGRDPAVRAIVVTGAGDSFCPGLDPGILADLTTGSRYSEDRRPQTFTTTVPTPVIAAINGNCAGIGLLQALYCDVRFVAAGARLSTAFSRRGLMAEDGASWLLSHMIGHARALELLLSGRVFTADEARELGLVHRVVETGPQTLASALEYARDLARNVSPHAMAMIKSQVYGDINSTLEQSRVRAQELVIEAKQHADFHEGVASFVEKRPPGFLAYPQPEA